MITPGRWLLLLFAALLSGACAPVSALRSDYWQALRQPDGSVFWLDEYRNNFV